METWRRLPTHVGSSALHFALSDALVRTSTRPTVWWHTTPHPTLILGAAQRTIDTSQCEDAGILVVRRQAGGTAVYAAAGVLGLDVMLTPGHRLAPADILETYRWLGEAWLVALASLGIDGHLVSIGEARAASPAPGDSLIRMACFGSLSPYEVTVGGRKLVGLAQVRRRSGVLLQSAIHRHFDAGLLAELLTAQSPDLAARLSEVAAGLDEVTSRVPDDDDVIRAVEDALRQREAIELEPGSWTAAELHNADVSPADLEDDATESPIPSAER